MKREFYEHLFLYELESVEPLDVLSRSLGRVKSYRLLDAILDLVTADGLESLAVLLEGSTYDLSKTRLADLLYKHRLSPAAYQQFLRLSIKSDSLKTPPFAGVLNYCYYKIKADSHSLDVFGLEKCILNAGDGHLSGEERRELCKVLKRLCLAHRSSEDLRLWINQFCKDEFLIAMMDLNARVCGEAYSISDLLLLQPFQIYGLDKTRLTELSLCVMNSADGACVCCGAEVAAVSNEIKAPDTGDYLSNALLEENLVSVCRVLRHCAEQRSPHTLRMLLRLYISEERRPIKWERRGFNAVPDTGEDIRAFLVAEAIKQFAITAEVEQVLISFLKSSKNVIERVLQLIPAMMRTEQLFFACFAAMADVFVGGCSPYIRIKIRQLIHLHSSCFIRIADMILEHWYSQYAVAKTPQSSRVSLVSTSKLPLSLSSSIRSHTLPANAQDMEFLLSLFSPLAEMFSMTSSNFVGLFFFNIFIIVHSRGTRFSQEFISSNSKYIVAKQIIDGNYSGVVDNIDVLVALLMNGLFDFGDFFQPNLQTFIRINLSQLLFKLKRAYQTGGYCYYGDRLDSLGPTVCGENGKPHLIYRILRFTLSHIEISLYFNYIWPTIEYFLNKECCECAFDFVEWLRCEHYNHVMAPYMKIPFVNPCDLPTTPNTPPKLFVILLRYFYYAGGGCRGIGSELMQLIESFTSHPSGLVPIPTQECFINNFLPIPVQEYFINNFLDCFNQNKVFRNKVLELYPACPPWLRALLGNLRTERRLIASKKAPADMMKHILECFLLKIDYEQQDLYSFVIQEFLKAIESPLDCEGIVRHFRYTRYKLDDDSLRLLDPPISDSLVMDGDYRAFLVSLFWLLYSHALEIPECFRYLVLLGTDILEYACLCLIKLSSQSSDIEHILDEISFDLPAGAREEIARFVLKINAFAGKELCSRTVCLRHALAIRDFYSVIYILDGLPADGYDLLQLAHYMVGDSTRVRGFNTLSGRYTPTGLFFEFVLDRNLEAARGCLKDTARDLASDRDSQALLGLLQEALASAEAVEDETEDAANCPLGRLGTLGSNEPDYILHAAADYQLLAQMNEGGIALVNRRREIAEKKEDILRIHRAMAVGLGIPAFARTVELEYVRMLRAKKDYVNCQRCIARLVLRRDWEGLYELALVKCEQRRFSEAKELLKRVMAHFSPSEEVYLKAAVKLGEISVNGPTFKKLISNLESGDSETNAPASSPFVSSPGLLRLKYLQRLYFLAAKHFEKERGDPIIALEFYYKSLDSNYEAVPRFFHLIATPPNKKTVLAEIDKLVDEIIKNHLSTILPYYNQICNKLSIQGESFSFYNKITGALLETFPYETFWNTLLLVNSKREDIRAKARALIDSLSLQSRSLFKKVERISQQFMEISRSTAQTLSMCDFTLPQMLPSEVNIPGRKAKISGVREEVFVFHSLQKPKKIVLVGDDGKEYPMIVKFKDDLRKDSRVMELDSLLNRLLGDGYYIRTYNVIPFTHDSGIIEYLPGLISLKNVFISVYGNMNEIMPLLKRHKKLGTNNLTKAMEVFPPVLNRWFKQNYCDSYEFYIRRENYTRTCAIMCAVGWFIGLGDRHAENVQIDGATGDTVHVDLNCIFDKGKKLEIPEHVPFRLTANVVDGFGSLGIEGTYRQTLCYALRIMKENKDVILANLLSFAFDPLFEWARKKTEPNRIIEDLHSRLGFEDEEEMARTLIEEAMNLENLGKMYVGWMAFL